LPVWSAVTPLAKDLTVHAGKGGNALAAQLSAVMEAIERVCGESLADDRVRNASYETLRKRSKQFVLDPESLNLPFDTAYTRERIIRWTVGYDIGGAEYIWVPVDAVISPAEEGVCRGAETNGLAAGNTITEATLHAVYELIERDAVSIEHFLDLHSEAGDRVASRARMVDLVQLPEQTRAWVNHLATKDLKVVVQDLTSDVGVPVFGALVIDESFAGNMSELTTFVGHGCDLSSRRAVLRAVTEATQAHSIVSIGARETFEGTRPLPDRSARLRRNLDILYSQEQAAFRADEFSSADLHCDLRIVVERLSIAGLKRCIIVDLTRSDLGIPVVRAIVPGLENPYGHSARRPGPRLLRHLV
jgi:ribosomal protein S12 methylthiotransferase accessory factor